jgi:hypothetical protein
LPISSAERINIDVTSIAVPSGGGAPTVSLTLTNDLQQGLFGTAASPTFRRAPRMVRQARSPTTMMVPTHTRLRAR